MVTDFFIPSVYMANSFFSPFFHVSISDSRYGVCFIFLFCFSCLCNIIKKIEINILNTKINVLCLF